MAVSARKMTRQRDYSRLFIALTVVAGIIALAPIVAAIAGVGGARVAPRTAFATAPSGEYMVLGRTDGDVDVISVVGRNSLDAPAEIARVPHMAGFASIGAVSPDGGHLALVVTDAGVPSHPVASLQVLDLKTGKLARAAENVSPEIAPVWNPDGEHVVVTRNVAGNESQGPIDVVAVDRSGSEETQLKTYASALGAYPVGFDNQSRLVTIVLDTGGTTLDRPGAEPLHLSANLTRDWRVSPDGKSIAFVEVDTAAGVQYLARTASLSSAVTSGVSAQSLSASVSALGAAWNPATDAPTFGVEPGAASGAGGGVSIQSLTANSVDGFDVPLAYSESGEALVVTHWTGDSFEAPGRPQLQVIDGPERVMFENQTRFFGWSSR